MSEKLRTHKASDLGVLMGKTPCPNCGKNLHGYIANKGHGLTTCRLCPLCDWNAVEAMLDPQPRLGRAQP